MRARRGEVIAEARELLVSAVVGAERSTELKAMCLECATTRWRWELRPCSRVEVSCGRIRLPPLDSQRLDA